MQPQQLDEQRDEYQIVDVREQDEWDAGHIEGSVHIPLGDLEGRLAEIDQGQPVATVCRSGRRSTDAAQALQRHGYTAESLDGGLEEWSESGLPLVTPGGGAGTVA